MTVRRGCASPNYKRYDQSRSAACGPNFRRSMTPGVFARRRTARLRCCAPLRGSLFPCTSKSLRTRKSLRLFFSFSLHLGSHNVIEPVGSVRPKFPSISNINGLVIHTNGTLPLLCPAQGFPVPSHRYYIIKYIPRVTRVS